MKIGFSEIKWAKLQPALPNPPQRWDGRGRPWRDDREVLAGILWVLQSGAPWRALPAEYPSFQTCHRRLQDWKRQSAWPRIVRTLTEELRQLGQGGLAERTIALWHGR